MRKKIKHSKTCVKPVFPGHLLAVTIVGILIGVFICLSYSTFGWRFTDQLAENIVLQLRSSLLNYVMFGFSQLGMYGTILGWASISFWFMYKRKWNLLTLTLILAVGGLLTGMGLKLIIDRDRPIFFALVEEASRSFPSAHMLNSTIFYLTLIYFQYHFSRRFFSSIALFFLLLVLVFMIGVSRVYLGVHYLSDVAAGFAFGVGYVALILFFFRIRELCLLRTKK